MRFGLLTSTASLLWLTTGAGCGGCDGGGFDAGIVDVPGVGGTASLAWSVIDSSTDRPVSCDKLDANASVFVEIRGSRAVDSAVFSCKSLQGVTDPLVPGTYTFQYELHLSATGIVIPATQGQSGVVVSAGQPVTLAPVTFPVNPTGGLSLMLRASATGNCGGTGVGITGMSISLEHDGGPGDTGCAPVVFQRSGGDPYDANDCSTPPSVSCIEATETLSVPSLASGTYQIHVRGKQGPLDCWRNDDVIRVPPQGRTLTQTLNLAKRTDIGCL